MALFLLQLLEKKRLSKIEQFVDFCGLTIEEARAKIDSMVNEIRMDRSSCHYRITTGIGNLQYEILEYIKTEYDLECSIDINNYCVILIYIE